MNEPFSVKKRKLNRWYLKNSVDSGQPVHSVQAYSPETFFLLVKGTYRLTTDSVGC